MKNVSTGKHDRAEADDFGDARQTDTDGTHRDQLETSAQYFYQHQMSIRCQQQQGGHHDIEAAEQRHAAGVRIDDRGECQPHAHRHDL